MNAYSRTFAVVAVALAGGCTSSTMIRSNPSGATMKENGVEIGTTPFALSTKDIALMVHEYTLSKEGYAPATLVVQRNEWDTGRVVAGLLFCAPSVAWAAEYPPAYSVELTPWGSAALPTSNATSAVVPAPVSGTAQVPAAVAAKAPWVSYPIGARVEVKLIDGSSVAGQLLAKRDNSIVVLKADGTEAVIARENIQSLKSR